MDAIAASLALLISACLSALLIVVLRPALARYALAMPNQRSSHVIPTPQGGGIAVIAACGVASVAALAVTGRPALEFAPVFAAIAAIAVVGAIDDVRPIPAGPRLLLQAACVCAVLFVLPDTLRVLPFLPFWLERALLTLALLWFVNLTNFMDGLDWMTVAQMLPLCLGLAFARYVAGLGGADTLIALALTGGLLGFAPFNRPRASLFLGDVGSLPIGLLSGWLLIRLAGEGYLAAALLLALYYACDATITLFLRWRRGATLWQAHRTHFYQRATDNGWSVRRIVGSVAALNIALALLAAVSTMLSWPMQMAAVAIGLGLVIGLLRAFARPVA